MRWCLRTAPRAAVNCCSLRRCGSFSTCFTRADREGSDGEKPSKASGLGRVDWRFILPASSRRGGNASGQGPLDLKTGETISGTIEEEVRGCSLISATFFELEPDGSHTGPSPKWRRTRRLRGLRHTYWSAIAYRKYVAPPPLAPGRTCHGRGLQRSSDLMRRPPPVWRKCSRKGYPLAGLSNRT